MYTILLLFIPNVYKTGISECNQENYKYLIANLIELLV